MKTSQQAERVTGTAPVGAKDEAAAANAVREMFTAIAPRYDLLNHLLSFNVDRYWWWRTARAFRPILQRPSSRVLDLCCGTADLARAMRKQAHASLSMVGIDFSHAMLVRGAAKTSRDNIRLAEADALRLPFPENTFDLVASAFGFRNLANYDAGLREIHRVLRAGGEVGILDFGEPSGVMGTLYRVYFKQVLPRVGTLISGVKGPYAYLPASVERFPSPNEMLARMQQAGFRDVSWQPFTFGIAGLFRARK
ncbi:MAG: bifunctional demethylmenaquinone methyltransferase/2-methoxy-6-polyprenyl-1,4-benzoquinol methylase UbiE [Acidobacteriales bacterium]|nr:bifunctional demethylmenaquinone methyltransferase/2-methoxy-6-polyprenyl-1,4-benzoquinol methylase UbiE [Terriglobales bacterium]